MDESQEEQPNVKARLLAEGAKRTAENVRRAKEVLSEIDNQDSTPETMSGVFERLRLGESIQVGRTKYGDFEIVVKKRLNGDKEVNGTWIIDHYACEVSPFDLVVYRAWKYVREVRLNAEKTGYQDEDFAS